MGWQLTLLVIHLLVLVVGFLLLYRIPRCGGQTGDESLSAFFNIVMTASMNEFAAWSPPARADGLFGPFLLISRTDYHRCGGARCGERAHS